MKIEREAKKRKNAPFQVYFFGRFLVWNWAKNAKTNKKVGGKRV